MHGRGLGALRWERGAAPGVLVPSFPSTWDEHAIDAHCWLAPALSALGAPARAGCETVGFAARRGARAGGSSSARAPLFSPLDNKQNFAARMRAYCGVF